MKTYLRFILVILPLISACSIDVDSELPGYWLYKENKNAEAEILEIKKEGDKWIGIMNGVERAEEYGIYYYVFAAQKLAIEPNGQISFVIGNRDFLRKRPKLSELGNTGNGSGSGDPMYFTGKLEKESLALVCKDRMGSCPEGTLIFKKVTKSQSLSEIAPN